MSELPQSALGYRAVVIEYFLGLRGAGLLVSPLDEEQVADWERRGVPVAVVCRGLRAGLEALAAERRRPPRSLRALRLAVEDEWRAYRSGRVGDAPAPTGEASVAEGRLAAARALLEDAAGGAGPALAAAYRGEAAALACGGPATLERVEAALAAADARLLLAWARSLPAPERAALGRRVRLVTGSRPRGASLRGHRETLRAHLLDAARRAGLTCLRGSV
jgi:hypothetical protein